MKFYKNLRVESRKHTSEKGKRRNRRFRSKELLKEGKKKKMGKYKYKCKCKCKCKRENAPFMPPTPLIPDAMML